jgi:hypothetical protein
MADDGDDGWINPKMNLLPALAAKVAPDTSREPAVVPLERVPLPPEFWLFQLIPTE